MRESVLLRKYRKVAVGGTFDKFHKGHEMLLSTAFSLGEEVLIGVTSDSFASSKMHPVESFSTRVQRIRQFLSKYSNDFEIKEIFDSCGSADTDSLLDAIVVSHETEKSAEYINNIRLEKGLIPLDIIVIDWVLADDGIPISSTRIRRREIDMEGRFL